MRGAEAIIMEHISVDTATWLFLVLDDARS
jgi:hypothetical protein